MENGAERPMVARWNILAFGTVVCLNLISTGGLCRAEEKLPRAIVELKPLFDYHLICADFIDKMYHCMVATSDNIYGPYGPRRLAIPHAGHNMFFQDKDGNWWATFFGNDSRAPFRERPAILRIE